LLTPSGAIGFILLTRSQCLFLPGSVQVPDRTTHGRGADLDAMSGFPELAMLDKGRIGVRIRVEGAVQLAEQPLSLMGARE
jgi:hypothetical protein